MDTKHLQEKHLNLVASHVGIATEVIKLFVVAVYGRQHSDELGNSLMLFRLLRMLRMLTIKKCLQPKAGIRSHNLRK